MKNIQVIQKNVKLVVGKKKIMKSISLLLMLLVLYACEFGVTKSQREYLDNLEPIKPTRKELNFIDSLKKSGFKEVYLNIPIPGLEKKGTSDYVVVLFLDYHENKSLSEDTLKEMSSRISNLLYANVIEDSIIVECRDINLQFHINETPQKDAPLSRAPIYISIDSLSEWNRFKVEEIGDRKYKRIKM